MMFLEKDYLLFRTLLDMLGTPQQYKFHEVTLTDRSEALNPIPSFKFSISLHKHNLNSRSQTYYSTITPYSFTKRAIIYCHQCE